jgi:hypothetical protein
MATEVSHSQPPLHRLSGERWHNPLERKLPKNQGGPTISATLKRLIFDFAKPPFSAKHGGGYLDRYGQARTMGAIGRVYSFAKSADFFRF